MQSLGLLPTVKYLLSYIMGDTSEKTGDEGNSTLVDISASGVSFTLTRSLLSSKNWLLSKIPDGEVPWGTYHEGRYYLDADSVAFRWALHFLRYTKLPSKVLNSTSEFEALRELADFLCFEELLEYMDSHAVAKKEASDKWEKEKALMQDVINKQKDNMKQQKDEIERYRSIVDRIDRMDGCIVKCRRGGGCQQEITIFWKQQNHQAVTNWQCFCGLENSITQHNMGGRKLVGKRTKSNFSDISSALGS